MSRCCIKKRRAPSWYGTPVLLLKRVAVELENSYSSPKLMLETSSVNLTSFMRPFTQKSRKHMSGSMVESFRLGQAHNTADSNPSLASYDESKPDACDFMVRKPRTFGRVRAIAPSWTRQPSDQSARALLRRSRATCLHATRTSSCHAEPRQTNQVLCECY
jgi:hypothetical protein